MWHSPRHFIMSARYCPRLLRIEIGMEKLEKGKILEMYEKKTRTLFWLNLHSFKA